MKKFDDILMRYTSGEADLEETNAALTEVGAGFRFIPGQNEITDEDRKQTVVGYYPEQANGYGLLDTGTGSMEKIHIVNGRLDHTVNEVQPEGGTNMTAYVIICGKTYEVLGDTLTEPRDVPAAPAVQKDVDMSRRTDLAGKKVEQTCRRGRFLVTYDADGYAVKAKRL